MNIAQGTRVDGERGAGPGGDCICLSCGYREPHQSNHPCNQIICPKCGQLMSRM